MPPKVKAKAKSSSVNKLASVKAGGVSKPPQPSKALKKRLKPLPTEPLQRFNAIHQRLGLHAAIEIEEEKKYRVKITVNGHSAIGDSRESKKEAKISTVEDILPFLEVMLEENIREMMRNDEEACSPSGAGEAKTQPEGSLEQQGRQEQEVGQNLNEGKEEQTRIQGAQKKGQMAAPEEDELDWGSEGDDDEDLLDLQ